MYQRRDLYSTNALIAASLLRFVVERIEEELCEVDDRRLEDRDNGSPAECTKIASLPEEDLRTRIIEMTAALSDMGEQQAAHQQRLIELGTAVHAKLPSVARLVAQWQEQQKALPETEEYEEQTAETFAKLIVSDDETLRQGLVAIEDEQEAEPSSKMHAFKVSVIRRCMAGIYQIPTPPRPIERLQAARYRRICA